MSQEEIAGAMQAQERQDTGAVREILEKSVKRGIDTSGAVLAAKRLEENLRTVEAATASAAGKKGESKAKEDVGGAGKANTAAVKSQEPSTNSAELSADEQQKAADEKELGNVAFAAGKYTKALKHFSKAIELGGDCAAYLTNRAAALVRLERYAEALADVERALALDKTHVKAWFRKGRRSKGSGALPTRWARTRRGCASCQTLRNSSRGSKTRALSSQPPRARTAQAAAGMPGLSATGRWHGRRRR